MSRSLKSNSWSSQPWGLLVFARRWSKIHGASRPLAVEPDARGQEQDSVWSLDDASADIKVALSMLYQRFKRWWEKKMFEEKDIDDECQLARFRRRGDMRRMSAEQRVVAARDYYTASPTAEHRALVIEHFEAARGRRMKALEIF